MPRHEREVRRLARRYGLSAEHNGSHWFLRDAAGRLVTVIGRTPSDPRWCEIAAGSIRRGLRQAEPPPPPLIGAVVVVDPARYTTGPWRKRKFAARTKSGRLSRAHKGVARDFGTPQAQAKRTALINGASVELAASASGILFANGHLEQRHFSAAINYARLHTLVFGRQGPTPCLLSKHLPWQGGFTPDEDGIGAAERKLIRLNGLLTDVQKQVLGNICVFGHLPHWFYMGKFKRLRWRTFPEDEVERRDLLDGLSILAKAMGFT